MLHLYNIQWAKWYLLTKTMQKSVTNRKLSRHKVEA